MNLLYRITREIVSWFVGLMALGYRFGHRLLQTEYVVAGGCKMRGACCHHILLEWSPWFDRFPWLGKLAMWKMTKFYRFYDRGYSWEISETLVARVMGCHALRADGLCGEHRIRPMFCRTYPQLPLTGRPLVLKGCGYKFERRDGVHEDPLHQEREDLIQIGALLSSGKKNAPPNELEEP